MTKVTIVPEANGPTSSRFRAVARDRESVGHTPGEALDALTRQLSDEEAGTLVIVQHMKPDSFFTAAQQKRLGDLMGKWREARDAGRSLEAAEQQELDELIRAELNASGLRAQAIAEELHS
jgi:hypothetical protein